MELTYITDNYQKNSVLIQLRNRILPIYLPQNRIENKCYKSKTTDFIKAVFHKSRYNLCIRVKLEKLGKYI